jgi:hypothetical protein
VNLPCGAHVTRRVPDKSSPRPRRRFFFALPPSDEQALPARSAVKRLLPSVSVGVSLPARHRLNQPVGWLWFPYAWGANAPRGIESTGWLCRLVTKRNTYECPRNATGKTGASGFYYFVVSIEPKYIVRVFGAMRSKNTRLFACANCRYS